MRLKQLLGIALLTMAAMATASASQLSGVLVKNHENTGTVTILANGPFTHTEYRPTDNLMLVDLAGVSLAHPDTRVHTVFAPGVRSYRIVNYRSPEGGEVARVEISLVRGANVKVSDVEGGLKLDFTGAPAVVPSKEAIEAEASNTATPSKPHLTHVRKVSVAQNAGGISIEIAGSGPMTAHTMKLTGPDRFVVDIPDSLLDGRPRDIAVNSNGIKDVRAARFQAAPPATRIVLDVAQSRDFEVVPEGNNLVIRLRDDRNAAPAAVPVLDANKTPAPAPAVDQKTAAQPVLSAASAKPAAAPASNFVMVNPNFEAKKDSPTGNAQEREAKLVEPEPSRADRAAALFAHDVPTVAPVNRPPFPASASLNAQPAAINAALQQQQAAPAPAVVEPTVSNCTSGRYTGEPIGMNFKDLDLKDFFRVIHEISGLNVVLDPAVKGSVTIVLDDVPWDQALAIVLNNNGLECQLQGNVLRIATLETLKTEAEARRAQQEAQALAVPKKTITRYLSYGQSKDAVTIVKKFLSPRGDVVADPRSNALIIEDIPSVLPKIDELLKTLDRKTPEVEIEARVVASTRTFARDIGTQFGFGYGFGNNAIGGPVGKSPIDVGNNPPTIIHNSQDDKSIPLFNDLGASAPSSGFQILNVSSNFRLDFILTMAESRGLLKILSRPHIVTQNNILALIKQGTRVPVVTNQQLGGPPTVTYIDAFLRLSVTPQITAENTIFLNVDVENTVPDFTRVTGQQLNPTLNTQQATTQVLVTDGGTVVIGGVVQTQNNLAIAQVPLLGSIPVLGNLFKHQTVNTQTQELIFFITPKIIQT
jgi:type IV pilus assembly protein PilQ